MSVLWYWLYCCSDKEAQCELIDQMMQEIIREEFDQEDALALAACLCQTLHTQFEPSILPLELDEELVHISCTQILYLAKHKLFSKH